MGARDPEFSEQFFPYVCLGDSISVDVGEYTITARITHDDTADKPDERDCGFGRALTRTPQDLSAQAMDGASGLRSNRPRPSPSWRHGLMMNGFIAA